jgi:hypothetical protein
MAEISEGSVEIYTQQCYKAIMRHHNQFVHILTREERREKRNGFRTTVVVLGGRKVG